MKKLIFLIVLLVFSYNVCLPQAATNDAGTQAILVGHGTTFSSILKTMSDAKKIQEYTKSLEESAAIKYAKRINQGLQVAKALRLTREIVALADRMVCQQDEFFDVVSLPGVASKCINDIKIQQISMEMQFSIDLLKYVVLSKNLVDQQLGTGDIIEVLEKIKNGLVKTIEAVEEMKNTLLSKFMGDVVNAYQSKYARYMMKKQFSYAMSIDRLEEIEEERRKNLRNSGVDDNVSGVTAERSKLSVVTGGEADVNRSVSAVKETSRPVVKKTRKLLGSLISMVLMLGLITSVYMVVTNSPKAKAAVISFLIALVLAAIGASLIPNIF